MSDSEVYGSFWEIPGAIPHCVDIEAVPVWKKYTARNSKVLAYIKKHYNARTYSECLYMANLTKSELSAVFEVLHNIHPDHRDSRYRFYTNMIDGMAKG